MPGRNASTSPASSRSARRIALAIAASSRSSRERGTQRTSTGNVPPGALDDGAGPPAVASRRANSAVSAVADIAAMRRSGRSVGRGVERERQPEVGRQVALVDLVEDDEPDAGQLGVLLQPARQHALGQHLDPRRRTDAPLVAGLVADEVADGACR